MYIKIKCLVISLVLFCLSCNKTNDESINDSNFKALQLGFHLAIKDSFLTDWEKTKDKNGDFLICVKDSSLIHNIQNLNEYDFKVLDSSTLCNLDNGQYYLILKPLELKSDSAIFRLYSDCIYKTEDTCINRMYCGGGIKLIMKKMQNNWSITDTIGSSN